MNQRRATDRLLHAELTALHLPGEIHFSVASEQRNGAHFAQIHPYRVVRVDRFFYLLASLWVFAILHFLGVWNAYLWPLIVANQPSAQPIMVSLPNLTDPTIGYLPVWGTIMAGCVLATLPILIVFVIFQDRFMASATVGAVRE